MWHLTFIWVHKFAAQSLTSNLSAETCLQPLCRSLIIYTKVTWCSSHLHPSNSLDLYLICIKDVSHSSMSQKMNLNSLIVLSHLGLNMDVSTQSRSHLIPIQVSRFVSYLHLDSLIYASFPPIWLLTSIQIPMFVSHLHPCDVSPQPRPQKLHLSSI